MLTLLYWLFMVPLLLLATLAKALFYWLLS